MVTTVNKYLKTNELQVNIPAFKILLKLKYKVLTWSENTLSVKSSLSELISSMVYIAYKVAYNQILRWAKRVSNYTKYNKYIRLLRWMYIDKVHLCC